MEAYRVEQQEAPRRAPRSLAHYARFYARTKPLGSFSALALLTLFALAVLAPFISPYDPTAHNLDNIWSGPTADHWMGTDQHGRDTLSRLLVGARWSLIIAFSATILGGVAGAAMGITSGYFKGRFDLIVQRLVDINQAVPGLLLTMIVVTAIGPSVTGVIVALSVSRITTGVRVIRSVALSAREATYVEAARAIGASSTRIIFKHVAPATVASFIIILSVSIGSVIVAEASLGFLGLGVQPPTATWGQMLNRAREAVRLSPWVPFFPGLAIVITVFSFNMLGDAIRDILDPKLRGR